MEDEMTSRLRMAAAVGLTTVAALVSAAPALAIDNGVPDGTNHPNVGLLAIEHDGVKDAWCSGFYAGPHKADPGIGVYVTAAHCLADLPALGFSGSDLTVTFEPEVTIDVDENTNTWATTAAAWHPAFAYATAADADYGVILLEDPVAGVVGVEFPRERLLDDLAARGGLRPRTVFDNVGYGTVPAFKGGPPDPFVPTTGRMFATSKFAGLTDTHLHLLTNSDAGYGGACYGDSGSPVLRHDSNTAVAFVSGGGDRICRAMNHPLRLDIPAARAFYRHYLQLP
jgi:trypsin